MMNNPKFTAGLNLVVGIFCLISCFGYTGILQIALMLLAIAILFLGAYSVNLLRRENMDPLYFSLASNLIGILVIIYFILQTQLTMGAIINFVVGLVLCLAIFVFISNLRKLKRK